MQGSVQWKVQGGSPEGSLQYHGDAKAGKAHSAAWFKKGWPCLWTSKHAD